MISKKRKIFIRELDWKLIFITLFIFIFGLIVLSSATHANATGDVKQLIKQIIGFVMGVIIVFISLFFDYNEIGKSYKQIYIICIILLAVLLIPGLGKSRGGATSWLSLGPLDFQTSELVKILFIISFAKIVDEKKEKLNNVKGVFEVLLYAVPILFLIAIQPDLGTVIVFSSIIFFIIFTAGLNNKIIKKIIIIFLLLLPVIYFLMAPHQKNRIQAFLHPTDITLKGNYQVMQSLIAIGSGGITGKGLYNGSQNQENFLPVQESDFIFAVIGEELGAIGMIVVIIAYYIFIRRLLYIAKNAKELYGTLIVVGVLGMFTYQIIQNIGMTVAVIPVTGVTLPFISYGGSSVVTSVISLGLVLNVHMRRKKINYNLK